MRNSRPGSIRTLAHYLCGPIAEVVGESQTVHAERLGEGGALERVENGDAARLERAERTPLGQAF